MSGTGTYAPERKGELASAIERNATEQQAEALVTWSRLLRNAIERQQWATVAAVEHAMRDTARILIERAER